MSELNRPETPGPWGGGRPGNDLTEQDIRAIADLPAWIEAHDALADLLTERGMELMEASARAEKAEAALVAVREWMQAVEGEVPELYEMGSVEDGWMQMIRAGRDVLAEHGYESAE